MDTFKLSEHAAINEDGWLWPVADTIAYRIIKQEVAEIPELVALCKQRRTCIQAGGNCGMWVDPLATEFERVYTFEPDPLNFRCLVHNVDRHNVSFIRAGLGHAPAQMGMAYHPTNCGAYQVNPDEPGDVQIIAVDQFGLKDVDLIQLDIEGFELFALEGAKETIARCKPVICVELRGHSNAYQYEDDHVRGWLAGMGYGLHKRLNFDEIWVPN